MENFTNSASEIALEVANLELTVTTMVITIVALSCFVVVAGVMLGPWHLFERRKAGEEDAPPSEDQATWTSIMRHLG